MTAKLNPVKTEDCPCKGERSWNWHKLRDLSPCEHAREIKYGNYMRWRANVEDEQVRVRRVLSEDPATVLWVEGAGIYLDEEEGYGAANL